MVIKLQFLENGSEYVEPEVTAYDNVEGNVAVIKDITKDDEVVESDKYNYIWKI